MAAAITLAGSVAAIDGDEPREAAQEHPRPPSAARGPGLLGHGERGARPIRTEQSEAPGRLLAPFVAGTRQIESRPTEGRPRRRSSPAAAHDSPKVKGEDRGIDAHLVEPRDVTGNELPAPRASPSMPPPTPSITLSVRSCRTRRQRLAPSAAHTASAR